MVCVFFFQAEDGIRDAQESRGLGDVYKRQRFDRAGQTVDVLWSYREKHETDVAGWPPEKYAQVLSLIHI